MSASTARFNFSALSCIDKRLKDDCDHRVNEDQKVINRQWGKPAPEEKPTDLAEQRIMNRFVLRRY